MLDDANHEHGSNLACSEDSQFPDKARRANVSAQANPKPAIGKPVTKAAAVSALALATAACGGGGSSGSSVAPAAPGTGGGGTPPPVVLKPETDAQAARFLLRAGFSANKTEIEAVKTLGYEPWLNREMNLSADQTAEQFFVSRGYDKVDGNRWYDSQNPTDNMIWSQLMTGGGQVRKRIALALSEFFVVSVNAINVSWRSQAMGEYWDLLNKFAFANYRDLLEELTLNPAMGLFLNTLGNRKADEKTGRSPDENFGREVMQLFSIGLHELNLDGTERAGPVETYSTEDVTGIAKAFTGYNYDYTGVSTIPAFDSGDRTIPEPKYVRQPMTADPAKWRYPKTTGYHSVAEKTFLGVTIPAGTNAADTLKTTLDTLFNHANVGPFFARQMIQRLVTSNPSPAYVRRVATIFNDNGAGKRGDLREVFKAILLDDEAISEAGLTNPGFGKLREPIIRFVQFGRTFGMTSKSGNWEIGDLSGSASQLAHAPLRSPSVFNFFRPGYVPTNSEASARNLVAPEFQIVSETSVAGYINFMELAVQTRGYWMRDLDITYAEEMKLAHDSQALLDRIDLLLTGQQMTQFVKDTILAALNAIDVSEASDEVSKRQRVQTGVFLAAISLDFLVQQ